MSSLLRTAIEDAAVSRQIIGTGDGLNTALAEFCRCQDELLLAVSNVVRQARVACQRAGVGYSAPWPGLTGRNMEDLKAIREMVCEYYGISEAELYSQDHHAEVVWPRQMACHLARLLTSHSTVEIGKLFGRDHSTVSYSDKAAKARIATEPAAARELVELQALWSQWRPHDGPHDA